MMNKFEYEIGIIGGGPAGAAAALYLNRAGLSPVLFEKKEFPRDVLCGEFLSQEVINFISDLGIYDDFKKLEQNTLTEFELHSHKGNKLVSPLNFKAVGMRRSVFDNFLIQTAAKNGTTVFQPCTVNEINHQEKNYILKCSLNEEEIRFKIKHLISAYGKQNILDKQLGRSFYNYKSNLNGIKFHIKKKYFQNLPLEKISLFTAPGIYCGINAVSEDLVTVCFLEDKNVQTGKARLTLLKLRELNKSFAELLTGSIENEIDNLPIYGTGNIYFGRRNLTENNILMAGDAAKVIAPLSGDGIGMAVESARLAAESLINGIKNNWNKNQISDYYTSEWKNKFNKRIFTASLAQKILLSSYGINLIKAAGVFPPLLNYIIKYTRNLEYK